MECLVRKTDTWMDDPARAERVAELRKNPLFDAKYQTRERAGDIIEVQEDGYWSIEHGYRQDIFLLICCPDVDLSGLDGSLYNSENERIIEKKRKYSLDISNITNNTLTEQEFTNLLTEKLPEIIKPNG